MCCYVLCARNACLLRLASWTRCVRPNSFSSRHANRKETRPPKENEWGIKKNTGHITAAPLYRVIGVLNGASCEVITHRTKQATTHSLFTYRQGLRVCEKRPGGINSSPADLSFVGPFFLSISPASFFESGDVQVTNRFELTPFSMSKGCLSFINFIYEDIRREWKYRLWLMNIYSELIRNGW